MGVKSFIKKSVAFVSALAMACSMVVMPAGASYAATDSTTTSTSGLELSKKIELQEDGNYKITLEAYSTGEDTEVTTTEPAPLDIVLVLDQSGSMSNNITSYKYTAQDSKSYSYDGYGRNSSYYYKDGDQYYQVKRGYDNEWSWDSFKYQTYYYLYYTKDGETYYLDGSSTTTNRPSITSSTATIWTGVLYTRQKSSTTRLKALKTAVTNFVSTVEKKASEDEVNHRIAMVGFAYSDKTDKDQAGDYKNTELFVGSKEYKYGSISIDNYRSAFQDITTTAGKNNITLSINQLAAEGTTRADLGMEIANNVFSNNPIQNGENRKRVVVMFTDGEPNNQSGFNDTIATNTINYAKESKQTYGASVFTVGILNGASPSGSITEPTDTARINRYMHYTSSNFPNASALNDSGTGGEAKADGYYKVATDAEILNDVFQTISNTVTNPSTTVKLTDKSILRDVISGNFTLPEGKTKDQIVSVYTDTSTSVNDDGTVVWSNKPQPYNMNNVSIDGNKVNVTGFDYSNKYVTKTHTGEKLIVEILVNGLNSGKDMDSNDTSDAKTGIYANSSEATPQVPINSPTVDIPEYSYVLDYGKKVVLPNVDAKTKNVYDDSQTKNYSATTMMNLSLAAPTDSKTLKGSYGTFTLENNQLTYQPGKINWDGFDSIFTFGTRVSDSKYEWYKTNVIPATSVYYEDDFASTETVAEGENASNIKIVYSGDWKTVPTNVKKDESTQDSLNSQYGWDSSYVDDTQFSNGSAHKSSTAGATATFRFTGTGVEIYSKTDLTAGKVMATLKQVDKNGNAVTDKDNKGLIVDNKSNSEYYQIPTLFFNDLEYGTYEVSIRVSAVIGETTDENGQQSKRSDYYLDGIRVYNPLGIAPKDPTVKNSYEQAGEYNATYKTVRDILLDASNFTNDQIGEDGKVKEDATFNNSGVVFIDEKENGESGTTSIIGEFKKYGPKDEVYLQKGQSIAFEINEGYTKLFVGAKTINGVATKMEVTDGNNARKSVDITSASDMYYEVDAKDSTKTPGRRLVIIKNTGDGLLSITKIRATGEGYVMDLGLTPSQVNELLEEDSTFSLLSVNRTDERGMAIENSSSDVEIDDSNKDNIDNNDTDNNTEQEPSSFIEKLFNSIIKWFSR